MLLRWLLRQGSDAQLILGARAAHTALQPLRLASWRMPLLPQVAVVLTVSTWQPSATTVVTADVHMIRTYLRPTKKTSVGSAFLLCGCLSWVRCSSRRPQLNSDVVRPPPQTRNRVAADLLAFWWKPVYEDWTEKLKSIGEAVFFDITGVEHKGLPVQRNVVGIAAKQKTIPASGGFQFTDQPRPSSNAGVDANTTEAETKPKQKFALPDLGVSSGKPLAVATNDAQDEQKPAVSLAEPQAASSAGYAQIQATFPKPDQAIPLQLLPKAGPPVASQLVRKIQTARVSAFLSQLVPRRMKTCQRHRQSLDYARRGR